MKHPGRATVVVHSRRIAGINAATLRDAVGLAMAVAAPHVAGEVSVAVVTDRAMQRLNRRFRGLDQPTDVLAFPFDKHARDGEPFGDIAIALGAARRQARAYGASLAVEMRRLAVHGTLHLCGYDHHAPEEAARMHGLTRRLLRRLEKK